MKKVMLYVLISLLTLVLAAGTAQAISIDFVGLAGGVIQTSPTGGVTGSSFPILATFVPPGFPSGTTWITGGLLNFTTGGLLTSSGTTGSFTNTYGAGGSFSITGTIGSATGTLVSASFLAPTTLTYGVTSGGGGTLTGFLTNVTVNTTLHNAFFPGQLANYTGGNITFSLGTASGAAPTNFNIPGASTNVVVATPEPASVLLFGSGLLGLGLWKRFRTMGKKERQNS